MMLYSTEYAARKNPDANRYELDDIPEHDQTTPGICSANSGEELHWLDGFRTRRMKSFLTIVA
jgi:hypothetical protein